MEIDKIDINKYISTLSLENKIKMGEVQTPYHIASELLNMLPYEIFTKTNLKWCEPGAGKGNISIVLFNKLLQSYIPFFSSIEDCKQHILNQITLIELNPLNITSLKLLFNPVNVIHTDFLSFEPGEKYDVIFGNPPFNSSGLKKVPTNSKQSKTNDGITIWCNFVIKSMDLLNDDGYLCFIIPCIWMKPDKAGIYNLFMKYKLLKIHCFNNTETNSMFCGQAQTPSVFVLIQKRLSTVSNKNIEIFDKINKTYINFILHQNMPIPNFCPNIIQKIYKFTQLYGCIEVEKSNMPPKHIELSDRKGGAYLCKNIKTCILKNNTPEFEYLYSIQPCVYAYKPKIIMAHGMYGFPYVDYKGEYGIANRDKYVILYRSIQDMDKLSTFLSTKTCLLFFEATKYRMKYLEKYIFSYIPDITKIPNFPDVITDETIANFFDFNELERKAIESMFKNYNRF